jgi:UDP:flavonoid glycosyltransferase YjiC (YdhE family)
MSRVLIAWELGGNLGHVVALTALARELRGRGHEVTFALRDLTNANLIARHGFRFFPAPMPVRGRVMTTYPSYAEMLSGETFPSANAALVGALAWRSIIDAVRPDLLVVDHAPVALLAARGLKLRTATFGIPFSIPAPGRPLPVFLKEHEDGAAQEEQVLERLNSALDGLCAPRLEQVSDLYRADATMLQTLPELDCFSPRAPESYVCPDATDAGDAIPAWPSARGQKVLVYLKAGPWVLPTLEALAAASASTVAYIDRRSGARGPIARPGLFVSEVPYKASAMIQQADLVVCHANHGTVVSAALAGKPLLMLPNYLEQALTARCVEDAGFGVTAAGKPAASLLGKCLERLGPGEPPHARARELGDRYLAVTGASMRGESVSRLERTLHV